MSEFGRNSTDYEHPWKVTDKRVEDAWFLLQLVCFFSERDQLGDINFYTDSSPSQRKDLEHICGIAWEEIVDSVNPWICHRCLTRGCNEGKTN